MKKYLLIIAALTIASFSATAQKLTILHVNDTHSHIEPIRSGNKLQEGGVIERAAFVDSVRKADGKKNVLLLHAGDFSQGTSYFSIFHGDVEVDLINAFGYDVVTLGNHEFDNGIEELTRRVKNLKCPVVCCNYDFSPFELGKYVKPYTIVRKAGKKIGVIGVLTDISSVVSRTIADRLPKLNAEDKVNEYAEYLKNVEKMRSGHCIDTYWLLRRLGFCEKNQKYRFHSRRTFAYLPRRNEAFHQSRWEGCTYRY
jgi:5'-nucleotidase